MLITILAWTLLIGGLVIGVVSIRDAMRGHDSW